MYFLLSPAKSLNEKDSIPVDINKYLTQPELIDSACQLMSILKTKEPTDLMDLMGISNKIAQLNTARNLSWIWDHKTPFSINNDNPAKPAVYLFDGDVYTGLDVYNMDEKSVAYLNQHLGILSGLYGLLNPLDLILPYRLEMGTKLDNPAGSNLYQFWNSQITDLIKQKIDVLSCKNLINLASNEYFKAVKQPILKKSNIKVITPRFEDEKSGKFKVISFYAKKARGLMVKYAVQNQITDVENLKKFNLENYYYHEDSSDDITWTFRRNEQ